MEEQRDAPARPLWDRIQAICGARGWNASRLERETGIRRRTIANWKTQPRSPQPTTVDKVATVLGIDREEALRLAGILAPAGGPAPKAPEGEPAKLTMEEMAARVTEMEQKIHRMEEEIRQEREQRDQGQSERREII